ncbi:hypothetical protein BKA62DRAFT_467019 [Auriculariales sp. MPI-PUGE-AT-0066]|nr:hypothetical protein BKA62DRAFT_467019 [Auriculariales sp. MPI-PUGE-AT-0066]
MKGRLLLDVVVREGATVLKLLAGKDKALLVRGTFLILNLRLHIIDGVRGLHLEGNSLASQSLHEDLPVSEVSTHSRWLRMGGTHMVTCT